MANKTIAIVNQKGGVGKTTTAINLSSNLAKNYKTLIVDLDPQANATSGLGISQSGQLSTFDLMTGDTTASSIIKKTHVAQLFIIPSSPDLAGAEIDIINRDKREYILKNSLANLKYDLIVIDCPPSLNLLTINALTASDLVLIPVQTEYYAMEGLSQLINTVQGVRVSTNPDLELLGILLTMYDKRNSLSSQVKNEIDNYFGDKLLKTIIPRNVKLAEAPSYGKTIYEHDKWSKGSRSYKNLSKEINNLLFE